MPASIPDPIPDDVKDAIIRWEKRENSKIFGFITTGFPRGRTEITKQLVLAIRQDCRDFKPTDTIDVALDSSGGDADAAYLLVTFLRYKCKKLRVFIRDWAKSAATLMCLGADEIWMSETGEMGALDAQIEDPRNPQELPVSALEQFRAMDYLKRYSYEMLDSYVNLLLKNLPSMRWKDIYSESTPFVTHLMSSLYQQIDPYHLGGSYRALDVAVEYGKRLMKRGTYKDWNDDKITKLVNKLTWEYPSHSFAIDYIEAKEIGLNANLFDNDKANDMDAIIGKMRVFLGFYNGDKESTNDNKT